MLSFQSLLDAIVSLPLEEAKKLVEKHKGYFNAEKLAYISFCLSVGDVAASTKESKTPVSDGTVVSPEGEVLTGFSVHEGK